MPRALIFGLYLGVALYAAIAYFLDSFIPLITVVIGFGLPILLYLALEWIGTPLVAALMGFHARRSVPMAIVLGVPLVVLFTVVTPVVSTGGKGLSIPVPWLVMYPSSQEEAMLIIRERLPWWGLVFLAGLVAGLISRRWCPPKDQPKVNGA